MCFRYYNIRQASRAWQNFNNSPSIS